MNIKTEPEWPKEDSYSDTLPKFAEVDVRNIKIEEEIKFEDDPIVDRNVSPTVKSEDVTQETNVKADSDEVENEQTEQDFTTIFEPKIEFVISPSNFDEDAGRVAVQEEHQDWRVDRPDISNLKSLNQVVQERTRNEEFGLSGCFPNEMQTSPFVGRFNVTATNNHESQKNKKGKRYYCTLCEKSYTQRSRLRSHVLLHTCEKPFTCKFCEKAFPRRDHLKIHMSIHTGAKRPTCSLCNKTFTENRNLKTHMLLHTGEKPFGCHICENRFTQRSHLKSHILVHTGERPYPCHLCDMSCSSKSNLTKHMAIHRRD